MLLWFLGVIDPLHARMSVRTLGQGLTYVGIWEMSEDEVVAVVTAVRKERRNAKFRTCASCWIPTSWSRRSSGAAHPNDCCAQRPWSSFYRFAAWEHLCRPKRTRFEVSNRVSVRKSFMNQVQYSRDPIAGGCSPSIHPASQPGLVFSFSSRWLAWRRL